MATVNKDEVLSRFMAVTQCSSGRDAREYLETAKWNEQAAIDFYFDSIDPQESEPIISPIRSQPDENNRSKPPPSSSSSSNNNEFDDHELQSAIEENLRLNAPKKDSPKDIPRRINQTKSIVSTRINTVDSFRRNDDEDSDEDDKGQAFYAGGSENSGQQIIGPPKSRDVEKKVTKIFEAARKQGATEVQNNESHSKQEKSFTGAGYSLNDEHVPSRAQGQPAAAAAAANRVEQLPIRFYSNGFTVGDGELRKFEDNREFMEYIKRGEVPPELRNMSTNGRQIEVQLEDHHNEEYKRVEPTFKAFTGTGQAVGLPMSNVTSHRSLVTTPASNSPPDVVRLEQLAAKRLKTSSSSTVLRLRLPDLSVPVTISIDLNRTLADVRRFLTENVPILQSNTFDFLEPPATKIKREDERKKISDAHLANSTLVVRRTA